MFSGIVDHCGTLLSIEKKLQGLLLCIRSRFTSPFSPGDSVAVDGICLTIIAFQGSDFECELSPETLNVSTASHYQVGDRVNLELALLQQSRINGHWVTGHVDETIVLSDKIERDEFVELSFSGFPPERQLYLMPKASVTINGVSLTINAVTETHFSVMVIPHTLARTNLSQLEVEDCVNVEWDYLAKWVAWQSEIR